MYDTVTSVIHESCTFLTKHVPFCSLLQYSVLLSTPYRVGGYPVMLFSCSDSWIEKSEQGGDFVANVR